MTSPGKIEKTQKAIHDASKKFAKGGKSEIKNAKGEIKSVGVVPSIAGQLPKFSSGARSYIRVGGKPLGVALDFRWQISAQATEVRSIDTNLPWELVPNQINISATLSQIIDPSTSNEAQGTFHTIQSMVHQPYVELQIQDASGYSVFFARGMFTGVSGQVSRGQMSTTSATFQGVLYQHNVFQNFTPYPGQPLSGLLKGMKNLQKTLSKVSGGFL